MRTRGGLNRSSISRAGSAQELLDLYEQLAEHRPGERTLDRLIQSGVHERVKRGRDGVRGGRAHGEFAPVQFAIVRLLARRSLAPPGTPRSAQADAVIELWLRGAHVPLTQIRRAYDTCRQGLGRSRAATVAHGKELADFLAGGLGKLEQSERARFAEQLQSLMSGGSLDRSLLAHAFGDAPAPVQVRRDAEPVWADAARMRRTISRLSELGLFGPVGLLLLRDAVMAAPAVPSDRGLELAQAFFQYFAPVLERQSIFHLVRDPPRSYAFGGQVVKPGSFQRRGFDILMLMLGAGALLDGNDQLVDELLTLAADQQGAGSD
jgi:hypothetical protein